MNFTHKQFFFGFIDTIHTMEIRKLTTSHNQETLAKSKISKLPEIHGRYVFCVTIHQLLGNYKVSSLAGVVRIPKNMLVTVWTHARRRPAGNYTSKLTTVPTASSTCTCESCKVIQLLFIATDLVFFLQQNRILWEYFPTNFLIHITIIFSSDRSWWNLV